MTTLSLPKGKTAILVMDCQNDNTHEQGGMAPLDNGEMVRLIKQKGMLGKIARLCAAARSARVPVIQVRHAYRPDYADAPRNMRMLHEIQQRQILRDGTWGAEINAEVKPDPTDIVVVKTRVSAFYSSPLEAILNSQGITHLVMTGVATDGVVDGTARDAADRGYYVIVAEDCCAAGKQEVHRALLDGMLGFLAEVCRSEDVIQALPR